MNARIYSLLAAMLIGVGPVARAQEGIRTPLHIGNTESIMDEYNRVLKGTDAAAASYGFAVVPGEVVQILQCNAGIFAPDINGQPHELNPVVATTYIGKGTDPALGPVGMFGLALPNRGSGDIFARVFNRHTLEESSFYGDSQTFTIPQFGQAYAIFIPYIPATSIPLDTADDDGDGLHNSWEKSIGSDRNNPDTDNDGMSDFAEFRAGTDLLDDTSMLAMVQLVPSSGTNMRVIWDSVAAKSYQVEFTADDLSNNPVYNSVSGVITATGAVTETTITNALLIEGGHYRVRLVE